ncbi:MAG: AraC family chitin signaling transcriptional activator [Porticoccaceae bacterium]|jgi:AraC family chitin signaling transcriptional activator
MSLHKFLPLFLFFCLSNSYSQERPPIEVYNAKDYNAENQNWAISQGDNQHIYIANNKGLLEFDGAKWELYLTPNKAILRSVCAINNRIYTGSYMDFGYWEKDKNNSLVYMSLSDELNIPLIEDEQFWKIVPIDDWILFQSLNRIYIYNTINKSYKFISSDTSITGIYKFNNDIYFQEINKGLYILKNGTAKLISENDILKDNIIVNIFNQNNSLLILTQDKGFYTLINNELLLSNKFNNEIILNSSIYSGVELRNGRLLLGTISDGLIEVGKSGKIHYQINNSNGLSNNTVLSVFEDKENNVWLALDKGINCINFNSPYRIFNDKNEILGTVYASRIFDNNLYIGSNQGLFYKPLNSDSDFTFIEGTQGQIWCLIEYDNTLFCGSNFGTFIIKGKSAKKISNVQGTWDIKPIVNNPNLLLQGNYNGLNILEKKGNSWGYRNKIQGFDISSRHFELLSDSEIFVNHEYKGVYQLKIDKEFLKINKIEKNNSINKSQHSSIFRYNNKIMYSNDNGIFQFSDGVFTKDSLLSNIYKKGGYISGKTVFDASHNDLWVFTEKNINKISPGILSNQPTVMSVPIPYRLRNGFSGYENIIHVKNDEYLMGTSSGYIIIDLERLESADKTYSIEITQIKGVKHKNNDTYQFININEKGEFENIDNNFKFFYSVPDYGKYQEIQYQYRLDGMYDEWSDWSTSPTAVFKNLPFGKYTFEVRGKVAEKLTSSKSYLFEIIRPWYLSNFLIVIYIVGLILLLTILHNSYKIYYKRQRIKLLEKSQRELQLKELESEQQIMYFKNENLEKDIDSKSRELAVSTMSLIKKNEFLSNIKNVLNALKDSNEVKSVIKLIDKNITSNDDWKLFEEAFNNADKDFLDKIKSKHQELSPNDLRLCAYLRLNLSSKEIAPLLNISHRSVEVKRYRLRKKMNLSRDLNLTSYILEI